MILSLQMVRGMGRERWKGGIGRTLLPFGYARGF